MNTDWTPPPAPMPVYPAQSPRRKRGMVAAVGLLGAGAVAGAVIGVTALSNAATPSSSASSSTSTSEVSEPHGGGGHGLDLSGTVTAVGPSTVTIKTSTGTTAYKVDSNSDIDKNGESSLSKLTVGDAVTFSVDSSATTTIDKLHTGTESLNRPAGGGTGGG
jgi:hypothetical protein